MALLGAACGLAPRRARATAAAACPGRARALWRRRGPLSPWRRRDAGVSVARPARRPRAAAIWRSDPNAAFSILQTRDTLNPLSDNADLVAGAIASRLHRYELMRARFQDAVDRSPDDWYANLELGIAASLTGTGARRARRCTGRCG